MIDHTGHPHPSTPAARALCRKNGGTGFIGKIGGHAPTAEKKDHDKKPHVPQGPVNTKPKEPKPPTAPPVKKGPTVTKDHGEPKPTTEKKPAPPTVKKPSQPTAKPAAGTRTVSVEDFNKNKMQVQDAKGNWHNVDQVFVSIGTGQTSYYNNEEGTIRRVPKGGKLTVRDKPGASPDLPKVPPRPVVPKRDIAKSMTLYVPLADPKEGTQETRRIQNAVRLGASRDFIVAQSKLTPAETNREIDAVLVKYGVPNHLYQRKGTGKKAPDIRSVKPAKPTVVTREAEAGGDVDTPSVSTLSPRTLSQVQKSIQVDAPVKAKVDRVVKVQAGIVGDKIKRIKSVKSNLPPADSVAGKQRGIKAGTLAVCSHDGHISLHKHMHEKDGIVQKSRQSGWFVQGGVDGIENTIAHEMGHALLTNFKMTATQRRQLAEAMIQHLELTNPYGDTIREWSTGHIEALVSNAANKAKIKRRISRYAATNLDEFIAEVWTDFSMNPKPKPAQKGIGSVIKDIISQRRVGGE